MGDTYNDDIYIKVKKYFDKDTFNNYYYIIKDVYNSKTDEMYFKYLSEFINKNIDKNNTFNKDKVFHYIQNRVNYDKRIEIFTDNITRYMKLKDKTVSDLSRDLKISYSTINDWVNGVNYPRADKIQLLADYFNITPTDLTEDKKSNLIPVLGSIPARYTY